MKSYALPSDQYGDPALVYENAEMKTCQGCGWIVRHEVTTIEATEREFRDDCAKGRPFGKRCKFYLETENDNSA